MAHGDLGIRALRSTFKVRSKLPRHSRNLIFAYHFPYLVA